MAQSKVVKAYWARQEHKQRLADGSQWYLNRSIPAHTNTTPHPCFMALVRSLRNFGGSFLLGPGHSPVKQTKTSTPPPRDDMAILPLLNRCIIHAPSPLRLQPFTSLAAGRIWVHDSSRAKSLLLAASNPRQHGIRKVKLVTKFLLPRNVYIFDGSHTALIPGLFQL
jgi:hypothetical protein